MGTARKSSSKNAFPREIKEASQAITRLRGKKEEAKMRRRNLNLMIIKYLILRTPMFQRVNQIKAFCQPEGLDTTGWHCNLWLIVARYRWVKFMGKQDTQIHNLCQRWEVIILHFDETYLFQPRLLQRGMPVDLRDMEGTRLLCAWDTLTRIARRIGDRKRCVTFIGRGDYHYVTYIFLRRLSFPFVLLVVDNHLDTRETFDGYISCGSWLKEALKLPQLVRTIFIGSNRTEGERFDKIHCADLDEDEIKCLMEDYPLYVSIDKDVFHPSYIKTNWDQGFTSPTKLLNVLSSLPQQRMAGIDICGEPEGCSLYDHGRSEKINLDLLKAILCPFSPLGETSLPSAA